MITRKATRWRICLTKSAREVAHCTLKRHTQSLSLWSLYVNESHRREGYATQLIETCQKEARDCQLPLWLRVKDDNQPAIALYEKCGFQHFSPRNARPERIYFIWHPPKKRSLFNRIFIRR